MESIIPGVGSYFGSDKELLVKDKEPSNTPSGTMEERSSGKVRVLSMTEDAWERALQKRTGSKLANMEDS